MDNGKYIIIKKDSLELPILFANILSHSYIAEGMKVISAGFFEVSCDDADITIYTYGKSVTLNKGIRPEDDGLIRRILREPDF